MKNPGDRFRDFDINPYSQMGHEECRTPARMRSRIAHYSRTDTLTRTVRDIAHRDGLSGEDHMTLLAFEALKRLETLQNHVLETAMRSVYGPAIICPLVPSPPPVPKLGSWVPYDPWSGA